MTNPDPAWRLDNEEDFVLEEDADFGVGDLEGVDLPPFDGETSPLADEEIAPPSPLSSDEAFAPTRAQTHAPAHPNPFARRTRTTQQPVPRITIHASCDRPEIADVIGAISTDRRMARAEISIDSGGIDAAVLRFSSQASPNLLILDSMMQGPALLHSLDRLAQVIEQGTKVVIIGAVNDIALFRELMARGVSEYIVPPIQPIDLIRRSAGSTSIPTSPSPAGSSPLSARAGA